MTLPASLKWVLLALVGLAIAIGIAIAAANLTSQQIGIANESVSAGDALAPSLQVPAEGSPQGGSGDRGGPEETTPTAPGSPSTGEEPAYEEPSSPTEGPPRPSERGEDHGGPDGDD